jgi:hypothetical protein
MIDRLEKDGAYHWTFPAKKVINYKRRENRQTKGQERINRHNSRYRGACFVMRLLRLRGNRIRPL